MCIWRKVFSSKKMNQMMECIFTEHQLVLSSYIVEELKDVVRRKFPNKVGVVDMLLAKMNYEYVYTPDILDETLVEIRDVDVDKPEILTSAEFVERYCRLN